MLIDKLPGYADLADELIKRTTINIINGMPLEDIIVSLSQLKTEEERYLVYMAASLLVETMSKQKPSSFRRVP